MSNLVTPRAHHRHFILAAWVLFLCYFEVVHDSHQYENIGLYIA